VTAGELRVVALLATYNEERFIEGCLEHLVRNGVEIYLLDNDSTDDTLGIAERYLGRGLIGIEPFPRYGVYSWRPILERKQQLSDELDADWFIHVDPDERHLAPAGSTSLRDALRDADRRGYNAVCFQEFTFVPTREEPDHDHPEYERTMHWYYPFLPRLRGNPSAEGAYRMNAWKKQPVPVDLASTAGHRVSFTRLRRYERSFPMLHYLFLSTDHAIRKYVKRRYDERELAAGWHGARARLQPADIVLQSQDELRCRTGVALDATAPLARHPLFSMQR
jgi:glycosyltransferase involved in cell wall biosynthesis